MYRRVHGLEPLCPDTYSLLTLPTTVHTSEVTFNDVFIKLDIQVENNQSLVVRLLEIHITV